MDWNSKFKVHYDYAKEWLKDEKAFAAGWQPTVKSLKQLMSDGGFDSTHAEALQSLRNKVRNGEARLNGHGSIKEDQGILEAVKAWGAKGPTLDDGVKMRAATLKMLRHIYLIKKAGSCQVWVHSLPTAFTDWTSNHINANCSTADAVKAVLRANHEHFSEDQKKYLGYASQHALAWAQKTGMILAEAASADAKAAKAKVNARNLVKRWFADSATTDAELNTYISTLTRGFKGIVAMLNKGRFILTDWVPLRGATAADELRFFNSEAFTFRASAEGMDVVYIESSFFKDVKGNVLQGQKNWTRIVVHELTHLVCGTEDVNIGNARYAWYGIGPHPGFPGSAAIRNADSWAFFCADCANVLTEAEREKALKII
ncbi:MAG TPA: M35 family metallo-endopeptidase [Burkholderiales bacterium]|nr:M35 family metallo-endopeptidase [Burkholderiales bacterium]